MSEPAKAGKNLEDPTANQTDDSDTNDTTMSHDTTNPKMAQRITDYQTMYAQQVTMHKYAVTNLGEPDEPATGHTVNVLDMACSCEDMEYNKANSESSEVCKHLAYVLSGSGRKIDVGDAIAYDLNTAVKDARDTLRDISGLAGQSETEADQTNQQAADTPEADAGDTAAAKDAADRLQSAFDEVIDDMQVESNGGLVWFQTGYDTPDDWPFPGGDDTFSVVTSPDMVKFVHDGSQDWADGPHPDYDKKPGEYFRNAIEPSDVDAYISEVLE